MSTAIERVLAAYRPHDAGEASDVARVRAALDHGDVSSRTAPMHVTGSALVVHPYSRRVLLRWHPRMAMWMQVGGHFDADEADPRLVALREAREETGLTDLQPVPGADPERPLQIVIVPVPAFAAEPAHEHADFRYLFVTDDPDSVVAESSEAELRWTDLERAVDEVSEANLRVFLSRVAAVIATLDPTTIGDAR